MLIKSIISINSKVSIKSKITIRSIIWITVRQVLVKCGSSAAHVLSLAGHIDNIDKIDNVDKIESMKKSIISINSKV